jgi:hypothetical protein
MLPILFVIVIFDSWTLCRSWLIVFVECCDGSLELVSLREGLRDPSLQMRDRNELDVLERLLVRETRRFGLFHGRTLSELL